MSGKTGDGTPIIRNPATRPVMEFLDNALALTRLFSNFLLCYYLSFLL